MKVSSNEILIILFLINLFLWIYCFLKERYLNKKILKNYKKWKCKIDTSGELLYMDIDIRASCDVSTDKIIKAKKLTEEFASALVDVIQRGEL